MRVKTGSVASGADRREDLVPKSTQENRSFPLADIPFDKLDLSQFNVRRIKAGRSVGEFAKVTARWSLLKSLSVRPVSE